MSTVLPIKNSHTLSCLVLTAGYTVHCSEGAVCKPSPSKPNVNPACCAISKEGLLIKLHYEHWKEQLKEKGSLDRLVLLHVLICGGDTNCSGFTIWHRYTEAPNELIPELAGQS